MTKGNIFRDELITTTLWRHMGKWRYSSAISDLSKGGGGQLHGNGTWAASRPSLDSDGNRIQVLQPVVRRYRLNHAREAGTLGIKRVHFFFYNICSKHVSLWWASDGVKRDWTREVRVELRTVSKQTVRCCHASLWEANGMSRHGSVQLLSIKFRENRFTGPRLAACGQNAKRHDEDKGRIFCNFSLRRHRNG